MLSSSAAKANQKANTRNQNIIGVALSAATRCKETASGNTSATNIRTNVQRGATQ